MMRLAFAATAGIFGAPVRWQQPNAMAPRLKPAFCTNARRPMTGGRFMATKAPRSESITGNGLVKIENRARHIRPSGQFDAVDTGSDCVAGDLQTFVRSLRAQAIFGKLRIQEGRQHGSLGDAWRPGERSAEGPFQSFFSSYSA